jgi:hypothetical protein
MAERRKIKPDHWHLSQNAKPDLLAAPEILYFLASYQLKRKDLKNEAIAIYSLLVAAMQND